MLATSQLALQILHRIGNPMRANQIVDASAGKIAKYVTRPWVIELLTQKLMQQAAAAPNGPKPLYPRYELTALGAIEAAKFLPRAVAHA